MNKYTDARYPDKINDLIDNEGGLSEEGKKTIEESGVQAKDPRLPELTPEDVGKMLSVDEEGNYKLVDAPNGGTKLYKHSIVLNGNLDYLIIVSNSQSEFTTGQDIKEAFAVLHNGYVESGNEGEGIVISCSDGSLMYEDNSLSDDMLLIFSSIDSDTVTEL